MTRRSVRIASIALGLLLVAAGAGLSGPVAAQSASSSSSAAPVEADDPSNLLWPPESPFPVDPPQPPKLPNEPVKFPPEPEEPPESPLPSEPDDLFPEPKY